ncbi:MAG TPA: 2-amino-4-hydroxy-6-hydroxymethyldihydropteridine diphosphokinase, partial [Chitinophagaceae bacterium]|nr:2-amino-4-hydroxy-6-hydroxymethyldihydropteridine diphosphokinase [Chitinophagaceae bacterium]
MNTIYVLTGGNVGNRINNIEEAANLLQQQIGKICRYSSVYETDAWGNTNQPDFLNQVLAIETRLNAPECLQQIFCIENK